MSCTSPLYGVRTSLNSETGKVGIKLLHEGNYLDFCYHYGKDNIVMFPCGHCASCKEAYQSEWALRCWLESLQYEHNYFITLTYNESFCPSFPIKKHLQGFLKRLSKAGLSCRHFGVGELGGETLRPHYHIILFGLDLNDLKYFGKSKSGDFLYKSDTISKLWSFGFSTVQECSPGLMYYCAGYCLSHNKNNVFSLKSNRPGIGRQFCEDNLVKIFHYDSIVGPNGRICPVPRYFEKVAEQLDFDISSVKDKRKSNMSLYERLDLQNNNVIYREELFLDKDKKMKDKLNRRRRLC